MRRAATAAAVAAFVLAGCSPDGPAKVPVTIEGAGGRHVFNAELARTPAAQERGLMHRAALTADAAMLFAPYPAGGGDPRVATFWMKDTPAALDILFIRADGRIANVAARARPFSTEYLQSDGPVGAVLEIRGGRAAELGIAAGDRATWPAPPGD